MKRVILILICTIISVRALCSATITVEQLYNMLINATPRLVYLKPFGGFPAVVSGYSYISNGVYFVDYNNNKGELRHVVNSPSLEIKITTKEGRKRVYYFDTVMLQDSATITGCESRLLSIKTEMKLDDIELINFSDGGKNYQYR